MYNKPIVSLVLIFATVFFTHVPLLEGAIGRGIQSPIQEQTSENLHFTKGYEYFTEKKYLPACEHLFTYLSNNSPDDNDYEWAEFFFGISLNKLGFSHAAVDILSRLVTRRPNPKIVSYSLELLEQISRTKPFDRDQLIHEVLGDYEYGFVDQHLADFVHYYQGVFDWEHGFFVWGDHHFQKIAQNTYYFHKFLYQKALLRIHQDRIDEAITLLNEILRTQLEADELKDEVRLTLARLHYEKGEFEEAQFMYSEITKPVLEQAQNLLERSWVQYRLGEYEEAMGLLYAFKAPSYQDFFTPEYYILKSFVYKGVCQYRNALSVIEEFHQYYRISLENIAKRNRLTEDDALLFVILHKNAIYNSWNFIQLLEREREICTQFSTKELYDYIDEIYALQLEETTKNFKRMVSEEYEKMANDLLKYEEEAHLMEYEIGLDIYQRVHQYHYVADQESIVTGKDNGRTIAYPFQGEFWTDELDQYHVTLVNKCQTAEEWDIFFK